MNNIISKTVTGLIFQAERALPGVQANLIPLGYSAAQLALFSNRIADLTAARDAHGAAKATLSANRDAHAALVKTVRSSMMISRDVLKPFLGRDHSVAWIEAGFVDNLQVGRTGESLLRNVQGINAYLTAHPEHQNAALNITAERFANLATQLMTGIAAVDTSNATVITLAKDRDAKAKLVRQELSLLLAKLRVSFDPFHAMWETVGFNRPGFKSVPEAPANVTAVLVSPTSVKVQCDAAPRAERYRIWKKVVGVDADFVLVETRSESDFVVEDLPPNAAVELAMSAVNSGGESGKSDSVIVVTDRSCPSP